MPEAITRLPRGLLPALLLLISLFAITACGTPSNSETPVKILPSANNTPAPNPPAVTEPTATAVAKPPVPDAVVTPADGPVEDGAGSSNNTAPAADVASWKSVQRSAAGVTYSYRYPPGWGADLSYCAPGAARTVSNELPTRCASTDILIGQKAKDVGPITGENISLNGKQAVKLIDKDPRNGMASRIYTVMVFDGTGVPLMGFSTLIGPGTDEATQNNITSLLDQVAGTLVVGR